MRKRIPEISTPKAAIKKTQVPSREVPISHPKRMTPYRQGSFGQYYYIHNRPKPTGTKRRFSQMEND